MFLKSVELQGFKSFPDKVKLQLGKGITAVVGPNGSGKSNISDAIKWVLGEQSTKSLRGTKMEDVIFGGTSLRKGSGYAYVNLVIDNNDMRLPISETEVSIGRKLYRSGDSEYTINAKQVRLKDIHELFMDTGVGRDGYSIIGQGKVEDVISSKSDERRDIFEEAAGISRFKYRKEEAERRLKQTNENLLRLNDIVTELEYRVEPLRIQSENATKFLTLSEEKSNLALSLGLYKLNAINNTIREADNKLTLLHLQKEEYDQLLESSDIQLEELSLKLRQLAIDVDNTRKELSLLEESISGFKSQIAVLDNDIFHTQKDIERIENESCDSGKNIEQNRLLLEQNINKLDELNAEKQAKQHELEQTKQQYKALNDDHSDINLQHNNLNDLYSNTSIMLAERRIELTQFENELALLNEKLDLSEHELLPIKNLITEYQEQFSLNSTELSSIKQKLEDNANKLSGLTIKLDNRNAKIKTAQNESSQIKDELLKSKQQVKILQDLELSNEGFSHSAKAIMDGAQKHSLSGVRGALAKLIMVPEKYAVAIEISLAGALQNIVVNNESDAKHCINYLKDRRLGRCTFLPISNIKPSHLGVSGLDDLQGYIGIASSLISCDNDFENIVSFLLGRTVIVDNINTATHIAKQYGYKFKIVTLDGQVVNFGGSMTGGSHNANSGIFSRSSKIKTLNEQIIKKELVRSELDQHINEMLEETNQINGIISAINSENQFSKDEEIRLQLSLNQYKLLCENKNAELERLHDLKDNSTLKKVELNICILKAKAEIDELQDKTASIKKNIEQFSGNKQGITVQIDDLSNLSQELSLQLLVIENEINNINAKNVEIDSSIENLDINSNKQQNIIELLNNKNADFLRDKDLLIQNNIEIEYKVEHLNESINNTIEQSNTIEKEQNEIRKNDKQYFSVRENIVMEQAKITERKNANKIEHDEIINQIFDEYNVTLSQLRLMELPQIDIKQATARVNKIKDDIRRLGMINVSAIEEYKEVNARYLMLKEQMEDIEQSRDEINKLIKALNSDMQTAFLEKFEIINNNFSDTFKQLFGGGTATLELTDPTDVLNTGINIVVQPPGKKVSIIEQFSGGEKALIAIAIYFAIIKVNPPPFCMLDEVEAALDDINIMRFATFLRAMSDKTQFIVVSHRRGTMEEADVLFGVTMQEKGVSTVLKLDINELEHTSKYIK